MAGERQALIEGYPYTASFVVPDNLEITVLAGDERTPVTISVRTPVTISVRPWTLPASLEDGR